MSSIRLANVSKSYRFYSSPWRRLFEVVSGQIQHTDFFALHPIDLEVSPGEVVGVVGNNGAGKSTLLKLVTQTVTPTTGTVEVEGRISALLELGGGFHPELSGRDNVYLGGSLAGLSNKEVDEIYPDLIEFSGIGYFIDQPVKTYSSGMFMRLAFSVATAVEPQILIIDEALSVGDAVFARKSFDRIMSFRESGKTILFCSHNLYEVEALCDRVLWLHRGRLRGDGDPAEVIAAYKSFLTTLAPDDRGPAPVPAQSPTIPTDADTIPTAIIRGNAQLNRVEVSADGVTGQELAIKSLESTLKIHFDFASDPDLPVPSVAVVIATRGGTTLASAGSHNDKIPLHLDELGNGTATLIFPNIPLLKGEYLLSFFLLCERGLHTYDGAEGIVRLLVSQDGFEQGLVTFRHEWQT